jgi:hypothetical protein
MLFLTFSPSVMGKNRSKNANAMAADGMTQAGQGAGDEQVKVGSQS